MRENKPSYVEGGDKAGLRCCPSMEFGNPMSQNILVFIAGFPDDEVSSSAPIITILSKKQNCRLICLCMPDLNSTLIDPKPWGYELKEVLHMIHSTIAVHVPDEKTKVSLIIHDWGAFFGYAFQNHYPERVERIVALDIGLIGGLSSMNPSHIPLVLLYQWWFAIAYFISQAFSKTLGEFLFKSFNLLPKFLQPCPFDVPPRPRSEIKVHMCYPYYHFWKSYLFDRSKLLVGKFPSCPLLFMVCYSLNEMLYCTCAKYLCACFVSSCIVWYKEKCHVSFEKVLGTNIRKSPFPVSCSGSRTLDAARCSGCDHA